MAIRSQQELYELIINEIQAQRPDITDTNQGSIVDVLAGAVSYATNEITQVAVDEFTKTFFDTADGPEVTGGPDNLQRLAVDHFGEQFRRPGAVQATGTVTFSRPTTDAGNVIIPAGTVVKTASNALGGSQRFQTTSEVVLTGVSINASVRALVAGIAGNVQASTVTQIEGALTDSSVTVTNSSNFTGGQPVQTDAEYRDTIRQLLTTLKGATLPALEATARTIGGVELATAVEFLQYVKEWDIGADQPVGAYFALPRAKIYIADVNGTASATLVQDVQNAVDKVRAAGVRVDVEGAVALPVTWSASISLNPAGPNFLTLQTDTTLLIDAMRGYIQALPIGSIFNRALARKFMLDTFGPAGTNDLMTWTTSVPTGDIIAASNEKLIPGTLGIG
jgi:hypothetical protein